LRGAGEPLAPPHPEPYAEQRMGRVPAEWRPERRSSRPRPRPCPGRSARPRRGAPRSASRARGGTGRRTGRQPAAPPALGAWRRAAGAAGRARPRSRAPGDLRDAGAGDLPRHSGGARAHRPRRVGRGDDPAGGLPARAEARPRAGRACRRRGGRRGRQAPLGGPTRLRALP
jgi:hypothetical protein